MILNRATKALGLILAIGIYSTSEAIFLSFIGAALLCKVAHNMFMSKTPTSVSNKWIS